MAESKRANVGDIARSVVLLFPETIIAARPDPGEPARDDRETVVLKSGASAGKPWRRKPRLQARLAPGLTIPFLRRALSIALALARGHLLLDLATPEKNSQRALEVTAQNALLSARTEEVTRLRTIVSALSFDPLSGGVETRDQALFVLGLPPGSHPDQRVIRARFRALATIHHPDGEMGSHVRMSQINAAMEILRRGGN
ncbi:J domain-containing protein [Varunaivibrio sulfuroxidans]|uniref:J domain-containing protein n=1 Tax=Varunaivibrio sulfuroxidans TaxID=1773489 RepID=UPI001FB4CC46|nr:J domain-containing protein [Varunaivibrio sulfuroxidans]